MSGAAPRHHRAALGRADLAWLLAAGVLPESSAAALCGFQPRAPATEHEPLDMKVLPPLPEFSRSENSGKAETAAALRAPQFHVSQTALAVSEDDAPAQLAAGEPLRELPQSDPDQSAPALVPLWPAGPLRRLLRRVLRAPVATAQWDTQRWIALVCRGQPLPPRPPQRYRPSWRGATALVIHDSEDLRVLNADLQQLVRQALASSSGLARIYWLDTQGQCWAAQWQGERRPLRWQQVKAARFATVPRWLWLGSAAALDSAAGESWRKQLRRHLQRRGELAWLRPGPGLQRPLRGVQVQRWDRPSAPGAGQYDLTHLLAALALAVRVEPVLLRALRRALALPVQAEIQVWSHADVLAEGAYACILKPERLAHYREQARQLPPTLGLRLAALIVDHHRHLSPLIQQEEAALAFDLLSGGRATDDPGQWRDVAQTLYQNSDTPLGQALGAYVQRARWRAHPSLWSSVPALAQAWVLAAKDEIKAGAPLPAGIPAGTVTQLLSTEPGGPQQPWRLQQRGQNLVLLPEHLAARNRPLARLNLPAAEAGVQLERDGHSRWLALGAHAADLGPLSPGQSLTLHAPGLSTRIDALLRPVWASEWGRDAQGLYVLLPPLGPWPQRFSWPLATDSVFGTPIRLSKRAALVFGIDRKYGPFAQLIVDTIVQMFRWIPPGEFWMGSPEAERLAIPDESARSVTSDEAPRHRVRHTQGYWLADTACTQALWLAVMGGKNPSQFADDLSCPVERVSWDEVQGFLQQLARQLGEGVEAVLPTEAQWEYACRAGTESAFAFGATVTTDQVNYDGNYPYGDAPKGVFRRRTVPVKALPANGWGLYQMHGNVWEWCVDGVRDYAGTADAEVLEDPIGPLEAAGPALRGGSWINYARFARSACRARARPGVRFDGVGFRFALRSSSPAAAGGPLDRV
ncbi:MAG: formylglycine-generating enzyme family protein [Rhodanobacteraceae bacterium]|nr:formylglycine-generating enzyme family protein [Rhodanobacteraceae bacterium]